MPSETYVRFRLDFGGTMRYNYRAGAEAQMEKGKSTKKKAVTTCCEDCVYYDYDEYTDDFSCQMSLDEDELERFMRRTVSGCPYYKFYDEYKSVRHQN